MARNRFAEAFRVLAGGKTGPSQEQLQQAAKAAVEHARRTTIGAFVGGYSGAGFNEALQYWQPGVGDANADSVRDLRQLRARSRDLIRNSPIASGALETSVSYVVGTGLTMQSRIDAAMLGLDDDAASEWQSNTEREFYLWANSVFCDAYGQQTFAEQQSLAFRSHEESGDTFVVLTGKKRPNWPYSLALQIVEADRVSNKDFAADTIEQAQGIKRDATGEPLAISICNRHPGQYLIMPASFQWQEIPVYGRSGRRNILHIFEKRRPGQVRGVPRLAPIIETLKQLTRYSTAEVDAAVNSAVMALFVKMDPDTFSELFDDESRQSVIESAKQWDGTLRSGAAVNLLPGESIESPNLNRPNPNFDPFVNAVMRQIGIGLNIPHEVLTKHFQSSYSAARAALLDAWRTFRIRRQWLAAKFCQPVYEEWLAEAVSLGRISAPGFFADPAIRAAWCCAQWSGDGPGALNPRDEAEAAKVRMEIGLTTLAEEIAAYDGGDWETKHRQQVREHEERVEEGLAAPVTMPQPGAPAPVMPPQPADDETEGDSTAIDRSIGE